MDNENIDARAIIYPQSVEEIVSLVELANQRKLSLYPMGSGTKLEPLLPKNKEGYLFSLRKMKKIIEYRPQNLSIEVEAGISVRELNQALLQDNLFYPINTNQDLTLGGQVAANEYGRKKFLYKSSRFYVLGLEFISPTGKIIRVGGRTVKNTSGYDLSQIIAGSWGSFGVITKITLSLKPIPEKIRTLGLVCGNLEQLVQQLNQILAERISLASLTFAFDGSSFNLSLELEGFQSSVDLQAEGLKNKYDLRDIPELCSQALLGMSLSVPIDNYSELLLSLADLSKKPSLLWGNITSGILEIEAPNLQEAELENIAQRLKGTLISDNKIIFQQNHDQFSQEILARIKKQIDPKNVFFPEIIAKGAGQHE